MNCEKAQHYLPLLDCGELTGRRRLRVEEHLSHCSQCTAYREDYRQLLAAAGNSVAEDGPAPAVMTRIRAHAREAVQSRPIIFRRPLVQVSAAAALLLVVLGTWSLLPSQRTRADRIGDVHAILAIAADGEDLIAEQGDGDSDEMLRGLAKQLLRMEGLVEDDTSETEFWEPQATIPQSHSTRGHPSRRCV